MKKLGIGAGVRNARKWNLALCFRQKPPLSVRVPEGWELTPDGVSHVCKIANITRPGATAVVIAANLRSHLANISQLDTRAFAEEAVRCFESRLFRAAAVLSWCGAISLLYHEVIRKHLAAFNTEALRRSNDWKVAKTPDDLARMKEIDFLNCLDSLSIIGKNVKQELQGCLTFRNGCGHPNSLQIGESRVAAHIETLILNVYSRF